MPRSVAIAPSLSERTYVPVNDDDIHLFDRIAPHVPDQSLQKITSASPTEDHDDKKPGSRGRGRNKEEDRDEDDDDTVPVWNGEGKTWNTGPRLRSFYSADDRCPPDVCPDSPPKTSVTVLDRRSPGRPRRQYDTTDGTGVTCAGGGT